MPRKARVVIKNGMYHIICKSNSDALLYRDDLDKQKYKSLLKKYCVQYGTRIHTICFMDNHIHFILELCGADMSAFMKSINVSYVAYYNRKYDRKGTLMGERYKSIIIKDRRNLIQASIYIHRNAKDLPKWKNKIEKYPFSSLGVFLGIQKDETNLIETDYIMRFLGENPKESRLTYARMIERDDRIQNEIKYSVDESYEYRSEKKNRYKSIKPDQIIDIVSEKFRISKNFLQVKNSKEFCEYRNMVVFLLRKYVNLKQREICEILGNITQTAVSRMCSAAIRTLDKYQFENIFDEMDKLCNERI